jgi:F-type H+-transporting ATPase subunit alpha
MKQVAGKLKLELAQFAELKAFSQFASALDAETQKRLARGFTLTQITKQDADSVYSVAEQVTFIICATQGVLDGIELEDVTSFLAELPISSQVKDAVKFDKKLTDELIQEIIDTAEMKKQAFQKVLEPVLV